MECVHLTALPVNQIQIQSHKTPFCRMIQKFYFNYPYYTRFGSVLWLTCVRSECTCLNPFNPNSESRREIRPMCALLLIFQWLKVRAVYVGLWIVKRWRHWGGASPFSVHKNTAWGTVCHVGTAWNRGGDRHWQGGRGMRQWWNHLSQTWHSDSCWKELNTTTVRKCNWRRSK